MLLESFSRYVSIWVGELCLKGSTVVYCLIGCVCLQKKKDNVLEALNNMGQHLRDVSSLLCDSGKERVPVMINHVNWC